MAEELKMIAERIRELREACDYTPQRLARELGIDEQVYLDYEENGENIPISVIYDIANKFSVDLSEILTGKTARLDTYCVVKKGQGVQVDRCPGYQFRDLAQNYAGKKMEPLIVVVEPADQNPKLIVHEGQEFNYVLEGTIKVIYDDKEIELSEGDSIYFNPTHPHGQKAVGDQPATFLTMIIGG
ncbi:MAG: cupin domain-containing protein [Clostridia bacterium]|nr:cupin domain-containing protein [Clostridia bacterium]